MSLFTHYLHERQDGICSLLYKYLKGIIRHSSNHRHPKKNTITHGTLQIL